MRTTRQLSITLPIEMADSIRARVHSGEYASESEVIRDGLRTLFARDEMVERWLREHVSQTYDAHVDNPSRGIPASEVRSILKQRISDGLK